MKLITGGAWQGQEVFAEELYRKNKKEHGTGSVCRIADGTDASPEEMKQADIVTHLHLWIKRMIREQCRKEDGKDILPDDGKMQELVLQSLKEIWNSNPELILTVQELGCGVVPIDALDRKWREITGRVCCQIAAEAEDVYRMTCGISMKIK